MRRTLIVASLLALVALPGCGVIFGYAGPQPVKVLTNEEGEGAIIYVDGIKTEPEVRAPGEVMIQIKGSHTVEARKDGMMKASQVGKDIRLDIVLLDILTLGIGHLVDYLTGAMYRFDSPITLNLGRAPEPVPTQPIQTTHPTDPSQPVEPVDLTPCPICGEPRGNETPCPHCGMD